MVARQIGLERAFQYDFVNEAQWFGCELSGTMPRRGESVRDESRCYDVERREECAEVAGVPGYETVAGLCECAYHDVSHRAPCGFT